MFKPFLKRVFSRKVKKYTQNMVHIYINHIVISIDLKEIISDVMRGGINIRMYYAI